MKLKNAQIREKVIDDCFFGFAQTRNIVRDTFSHNRVYDATLTPIHRKITHGTDDRTTHQALVSR